METIQNVIPSEATKAHWNITLKENSNLNLEFFQSLCKQSQIGLASLIYPLHYASIEHNELKRTYEKFVRPYVQN